MSEQYYVGRGGKQSSPMSWAHLCKQARDGLLRENDMIWSQSLGTWTRASAVPGLFGPPAASPGGAARGARAFVGAGRRELEKYRKKRSRWAFYFFLFLIPVAFVVIIISVGELSAEVWMALGAFLGVTIILSLFSSRRTSHGWRGRIQDKKIKTLRYRDDSIDTGYSTRQQCLLEVQTSRGKRVRTEVSGSMYNYFDVGDSIIKIGGFAYPEKINLDGINRGCINCGRVFEEGRELCPTCRAPAIDPRKF